MNKDTFIEDRMRLKIRNVYATIFQLSNYNKKQLKEKEDVIIQELKSSLQEQLNQFKEMITEYDEIYINEEVRQAINRMKWKLTDLLK